jgi:hypothetical protein
MISRECRIHLHMTRLVLHLFSHDAQASITVERNPLMTYTELGFSLPAARDLWRAPSAEAWREIYLRKKPLPAGTKIPRMCESMSSMSVLETLEQFVDIELCYNAILYGYWGQICAYREAVRFYGQRITSSSSSYTHRLWLTSQNQELYRDVSEFAMLISSSTTPAPHLSVLAELLMMILHVSPGELQRFAGKQGEDEAGQAATSLEDNWAGSRDARHAVWHAGQILRNARALPPTGLRGFNAIAVYLASLTLWIYGLLSCAGSTNGSSTNQQRQYRDESTNGYSHHNYTPSDPSSMLQAPGSTTATSDTMATSYVLVDGQESRETRAFLQLDKGMPGITLDGDVHGGVESLANPGIVLGIVRNVFRGNFPVRTEPLPPLVESLGNLLQDLGSGPSACCPSRDSSRAVSEDREPSGLHANGYGSGSGSESESDGGE